MKPVLDVRPPQSEYATGFWNRALFLILATIALLVLGALVQPAFAQSASKAKNSAAAAKVSKDAAAAAARKAAEDAAAAAALKAAADEAAAKIAAAAAAAEAQKNAAAALAAQQAAAAAELAAKEAAAKLAAEQAANEAIEKQKQAEAQALTFARQRAEAEKLDAEAKAQAHAAKEAETRAAKDKADELAAQAKVEADKAKEESEKTRANSEDADLDSKRADDEATRAENAEKAYHEAASDEAKNKALEELNDATTKAEQHENTAQGHKNEADQHGNAASGHRDNAKAKLDAMPPLLGGIGDPIQSRSWLLCGGSYPGWAQDVGGPAGAPGFCAQVVLNVVATNDPSRMNIVMRIRNISGLFNSYMGSVLTGLGLDNVWVNSDGDEHASNPSLPLIEGSCVPGDQNCAGRWTVALANHAHMPNGIGRVDLKFDAAGLLGGIASTCDAAPNLPEWGSPVNPNGLFVTDCYDPNSWVTFTVTTNAPVDLSRAQVSLRAQNGYPAGEGSTACIYTGDGSDQSGNICGTSTVPEPGTVVLTGTGIAALLAARRKRKRGLDS